MNLLLTNGVLIKVNLNLPMCSNNIIVGLWPLILVFAPHVLKEKLNFLINKFLPCLDYTNMKKRTYVSIIIRK